MATQIISTLPLITITHTFTGWWVACDGRGMHIHPFTTAHAAENYAARLAR